MGENLYIAADATEGIEMAIEYWFSESESTPTYKQVCGSIPTHTLQIPCPVGTRGVTSAEQVGQSPTAF